MNGVMQRHLGEPLLPQAVGESAPGFLLHSPSIRHSRVWELGVLHILPDRRDRVQPDHDNLMEMLVGHLGTVQT